ncbi:2,4-diacetylphloroglucinol hydrolase [Pseudomonas sp. Seg1]|uniref:2,4-diacetylphloroglucinol hydrolase n=1 Tax=unclassified Pseudomonas TaxID=196821 RepID=UPI000CD0FDC8|nr:MULTISPECIES: 2,4-diacetylphloroglucinol hydrolase [unclassified Pseudomonas]POA50084.1 2,4-diacetylphloroglucinol hydrolase [Pseudomonas sp. MPR-ANC1]BBP70871.1 2,4-diacetylphloroglucinol hydrolase [Pseudomonas sp. Seg1]
MDARVMTPFTYFSLPMQKQFLRNREAIKDKPYAKYFSAQMNVPLSAVCKIQQGPLPLEQTLTPSIEDINRLLEADFVSEESGYALLPGPMAYVQSRKFFPRSTAAMLKWWFMWHPLEAERYTLWFPYAHVSNPCVNHERLKQTSLSFEQRLYGNTFCASEYVGDRLMHLHIHFQDPEKLGLRADLYREAKIDGSVSALMSLAEQPEVPVSLMVHLFKETPEGLYLTSRYWVGSHPSMSRFPGAEKAAALMEANGFGEAELETLAYEFAVHDLCEFNHLASFLPELYREFGAA